MSTVEEKVDKLEKFLEEFVKTVGVEFNKSYNLFSQLQIEMREGWARFRQELAEANEMWRRELNNGWEKFKQELIEREENWQKRMQQLREEFSQEMKERDERWEKERREREERLQNELRERDERLQRELSQMREEFAKEMRERDERWEKERKDWEERLQKEMKERDERLERERKEWEERLQKEMKERDEKWERERKKLVKEWNLKWGELANRLGTMVEDLVYPSLPRIIKEEFGIDVEFIAVDVKKRINGREKEYDAVAIAGNYVFINSTKSKLKNKDVDDFVNDILEFRTFFSEHADKKLIGILATLRIDEGVLKYAEKTGFLVLAVGEKLMEVKNSKDFKPKEW